MTKQKSFWIKHFLVTLIASATISSVHAQSNGLKLWYKQPAVKWTDALPIGNGTLGAMIYGDPGRDHIQFNEQTLWTGGPRAYDRKGAYQYLPVIRKLLADGKQAEAESIAQTHFMGLKSHEASYAVDSAAWVRKARSNVKPAAADFNDSKWKTIEQPLANGWETIPGFEGLDGAVWLRNSFYLSPDMTGKKMVLNIGRVRDMDFSYVNGKLIGSANNTKSRKYVIPEGVLHAGVNTIAIQVLNFYDKGGLTTIKEKQEVYPETEPSTAIVLNPEWKYWVQDDNPPAYPRYNADYQPFGDLYLQFPQQKASSYKRDLDISNATAHVYYNAGGVNYTREYIADAPDKVIAIHLTADQPNKITCNALLNTLHKSFYTKKVDDHTLALYLKVHDGVLHGVSYLYVKTAGGKADVSSKEIKITGANEATLCLIAATNFKSYKDVSGNPEAICQLVKSRLAKKSYQQIRTSHIKDYQHYFNRFSINLGTTANGTLPTDERILKFSNAADPSLIALYVQYGRYLLISSSRPGSKEPANLQGLWNNLPEPPWGSKFTTNINLEMNYWPSEELNLQACSEPLFDMIHELSQTGCITAKTYYNAPGWVLHHNTDLWRGTAAVNSSAHGIWVSGGAWLCHQLWEHYLFTKDQNFLRKSAYPEMRGAAEFFVHFLVKDPETGYLISTPSNSPEHGGLVAGPTMDHQIIRDLYKNCIAASQILGIDSKFRDTLQDQYSRIAPDKIGRYRQLQEWMQDKDDTADTHRHVSHMWGVYPGTDITWNTPELMKAARQSLIYRGDEGTGWSIAWKVNLWARLKDGDHAMKLFDMLLSPADVSSGKEKGGVYHNLFDAHPPFQIDGNFGGAAGLAEMLLQSQGDAIELLPALPSTLPRGEVKGICARGGFELNYSWDKGELKHVKVLSKAGGICKLRYHDKTVTINTKKGETFRFDDMLKRI
ncbi:MAG: glycoside hydrolase family 95 protein [Bacteroidetes bacterium]|jgi:alpha-L-fucosidase 2|nr:glycoside hydrolase family 95 protein [Bacteroidota bacterium]